MLMNCEEELLELSLKYLRKNYDYVWFKTMLSKARSVLGNPESTLIVGSSHALYGFEEGMWSNAVNLSMHSQDLYYDYLSSKRVIENTNHQIKKCFIVLGYYIAYQDLSLSSVMREKMIAKVYYPIFRDAHNWKTPYCVDRWNGIGRYSDEISNVCEKMATMTMWDSTYFSDIRKRGVLFDFGGKAWKDLELPQKRIFAEQRAEMHNKVMRHSASMIENTYIMKEYINFLYKHNIQPIVVVTPFTEEYNRFICPEMKRDLLKMLDELPHNVDFVDFNDCDLFDESDFMDTDHLNLKGAKKVSQMLINMFGK